MKYKSIVIILFILVAIGFIGGYYNYKQKLDNNLNKVIAQDNSLGFTIDRNEVETGTVDAPNTLKGPNLIGVSRIDAINLLEKLTVKTEIIEEYSAIYDKDIVFWQSIVPETPLIGQETMVFSVSLGAKEGEESLGETITVPDLMGLEASVAATKLVAKGFKVDYEYKANGDYGQGIVYSQNYKVDAQVAKGTVVTLRISMGSN